MRIGTLAVITLAAGALLPLAAPAQPGAGPGGPQRERVQTTAENDDGAGAPIFGRQLMTREEMEQHRTRMRAAKTEQERQQIRAEHHQRMMERARERGVTLPDEPPADRGPGKGPGRR